MSLQLEDFAHRGQEVIHLYRQHHQRPSRPMADDDERSNGQVCYSCLDWSCGHSVRRSEVQVSTHEPKYLGMECI